MRSLLVALALLSLTACGTTVPPGQAPVAGPQDQGLGAPLSPIPNGVSTPGPAAAVPGSPGGSTDGAPNAAVPTSAPPNRPGRTTVGADRTPIKVGIVYANNDAAAAAGVDNRTSFSSRRVFESMVTAWNARGGLAGRRIVPTYAELRSSSSSYAADLQTACTRLTQDARVAVVLGVIGLYVESFNACLDQAGVPFISGDYALGDDDSLRKNAGFLSPTTISTDSRMRSLLTHLTNTKRLVPPDRLGVVVEGCPYNVRAYERTVVPTAKRLGVPVRDHVVARCFEDISDFGSLTSEMSSAVLRFAGQGITAVTFVSGSVEGNFMLLFATAAEAQAYHPKYGVTSAVAATVQEASNTPPEQLKRTTGLGWLPSLDTTRTVPSTRASQQCLADLRRDGLTPQSGTDRFTALSVCDTFALYDAALRVTRGRTALNAVAAAVQSLGTGFGGAATYGGITDFRAGRRAGPAQARLFAWSTGCDCFDYTGNPFPLSS